jgi:hypothetical protein
LEQFHFNIESAQTTIAGTEVAVRAVKSAADQAVDLLIQGRNDTNAIEDRQIIGSALRSIQRQLLQDLNSMIGGKYILGGTNTKVAPFTMCDFTGHLWFNVTPEAIIRSEDGSGRILVDADHGVNGWNIFEMTGEEFTEMQRLESLNFDLTGAFHEFHFRDELINPTSVVNLRMTGVELIGYGPDNLFNLIGRLALAFETNDMDSIDGPMVNPMDGTGIFELQFGPDGELWNSGGMGFWDLSGTRLEDALIARHPDRTQVNEQFGANDDLWRDPDEPGSEYMIRPEMPGWRPYTETTMTRYLSLEYHMAFFNAGSPADGLFARLQSRQLNVLIELTEIGERDNHVNFLKGRNEDAMYHLQVWQNKLEAIPPEEAIMNFRLHQFVYNASLQMGAALFQPGLMQFITR